MFDTMWTWLIDRMILNAYMIFRWDLRVNPGNYSAKFRADRYSERYLRFKWQLACEWMEEYYAATGRNPPPTYDELVQEHMCMGAKKDALVVEVRNLEAEIERLQNRLAADSYEAEEARTAACFPVLHDDRVRCVVCNEKTKIACSNPLCQRQGGKSTGEQLRFCFNKKRNCYKLFHERLLEED